MWSSIHSSLGVGKLIKQEKLISDEELAAIFSLDTMLSNIQVGFILKEHHQFNMYSPSNKKKDHLSERATAINFSCLLFANVK